MPSLLPIQQENRGRRREGFKQCLQHPGSTPGPAVPPRWRGAGATGAASCAGPAGWGCTTPPPSCAAPSPAQGLILPLRALAAPARSAKAPAWGHLSQPGPIGQAGLRPCALSRVQRWGRRLREARTAPAPSSPRGRRRGGGRPAVPGPACPGLLSCGRVVLPRRVLLQRGVPRHPHLRGGPDGQRALRDVPDGSLPRAHQPGPCPLRQQQRHLPVGVPPAAGHVPPGALHRRAPLRELLG